MRASWESSIGAVNILFGNGCLRQIGERAKSLGAVRPLLVVDPGVSAAGYAKLAEASLHEAGLNPTVFDQAEENPSEKNVELGAGIARQAQTDFIVAVGGGSVLDCAKGINFVLTNGGRMRDYQGYGRTTRPLVPSLGVPTTAGTGSEAQSYALISQDDDHSKMACGSTDAAFNEVLLDPELIATVPRTVAAAASLDALSHAVESFVSTRANPISQLLSKQAWRLLDSAVDIYLETPGDSQACQSMLLGAHLAGAAIEKSMLGAAHACANPLTATFGLTHGVAVALMLPAIVERNAQQVEAAYADLLDLAVDSKPAPSQQLVTRLQQLNRLAGLGPGLGDYGVQHDSLRALARSAFDQWTVRFNPRPLGVEQLLECYEASF